MEERRKLLEKFLANVCTPEELRQANLFLDTEEGDRMLLEIIKQREQAQTTRFQEDEPIIEAIYRKKRTELMRRFSNDKSHFRYPFLTRTIRRASIAAVFAGIVILSVFLMNNKGTGLFGGKEQAIAYAELTNPDGIPERYELPDGTQIWLAAGSTLKYPEPFSMKQRDVELTGEAFFDVARDEKRPFTIRTGEMETRVLGTSFRVTAFAGQEQEVSVATGKVSVSSNGQELALLTRGLQVRHDPETGKATQAEFDPTVLEQWKTGALIFDKLPMGHVAEQLENRYGITIEFADLQIEVRRVRGTFEPEEPLETIMELLGIAGNFRYKKSNEKTYTIY